jgi:hypothetical protein
MKLAKITGFSYNEISRHLNILEEQKLIFQEYRCGTRSAWLDLENENIPTLLNTIKLLHAPTAKSHQQPIKVLPEKASHRSQTGYQKDILENSNSSGNTKKRNVGKYV